MKKIIISTLVLLALLLLSFDSLHPWLSDFFHPAFFTVLFLVFATYAAFIVRERFADEREEEHVMLSGRVAYLAGAFVLVVGIIAGGLHNVMNPWLVGALVAMIVGKFGTRIYCEYYR
jgi:amino acid transporter